MTTPAETSCDCCGEMVPTDQIRTVIACGIETGACRKCRGAYDGGDEE